MYGYKVRNIKILIGLDVMHRKNMRCFCRLDLFAYFWNLTMINLSILIIRLDLNTFWHSSNASFKITAALLNINPIKTLHFWVLYVRCWSSGLDHFHPFWNISQTIWTITVRVLDCIQCICQKTIRRLSFIIPWTQIQDIQKFENLNFTLDIIIGLFNSINNKLPKYIIRNLLKTIYVEKGKT